MQDRALYSIQEARKLLGGISRNTIYHLPADWTVGYVMDA